MSGEIRNGLGVSGVSPEWQTYIAPNGGKAVVTGLTPEKFRVTLFCEIQGPRPIPREMRIAGANSPRLAEAELQRLLKGWTSKGVGTLSGTHIYGVDLADMVSALRPKSAEKDLDPEKWADLLEGPLSEGILHALPLEARADFRSVRELRASIRWSVCAAVYSAALDQGAKAPVARVAEFLGLSTEEVRKSLNKAREKGFLTKAQQGRAEGQVTDHALRFLREVRKAKGRRS